MASVLIRGPTINPGPATQPHDLENNLGFRMRGKNQRFVLLVNSLRLTGQTGTTEPNAGIRDIEAQTPVASPTKKDPGQTKSANNPGMELLYRRIGAGQPGTGRRRGNSLR